MYKLLAVAVLFAALPSNARAEDKIPVTQAKQEGIATCLAMVSSAANAIIDDKPHSSLSTWNIQSPNKRIFNSQIAVKYSDGYGLASLTAAPTAANQCDVSYTRVMSIPEPCDVLRKTAYQDWEGTTDTTSNLITLSNGSANMIMMPFLTGCTLVTTVVAYE